jgi:hypothetical protein
MMNLDACFTMFGTEDFDGIGAASLAEQATVLLDKRGLLRSSGPRFALTANVLLQDLGSFRISFARCLVLIKVGLCLDQQLLAFRNDAIACLTQYSETH